MIREKNFKPGPCDDTCLNKPMPNPELEMKLVKYYAGQILQFSANTTTLHYGDTLTYQVSHNYTGYIEMSGTLPTRTLWVENGHASVSVDSTIPLGTHRLRVQRVIPQQPPNANHEVLDPQFTNTLPFSNELTLNFVGDTPLPGDLDSDGHVNIYDYNLLVSKFGNPYTIFDYNNLVGNFGK